MRRYAVVLRHPGVLWPFLLAFPARLPISMGPLGVVLLVQSERGSYALAGAVSAALTVGVAVGGPGWGLLLDRVGQTRVLLPISLASGSLLAALALATVGTVPAPGLVLLAAGVGLTFPPISPGMRAVWRSAVADPRDLPAAYALEAVVIETVFVGGPLLLSVILVLGPPVLPLLVTAAFLVLGGAGYALTPAVRAWRPVGQPDGSGGRGRSPLRSGGVLAALSVALLLAIGFGQVDVSLAATAESLLGGQDRVGLLFMCLAGGSAIGGFVYGARTWADPEHPRLPRTLGAFTVGLVVLAVLVDREVSALIVLLPVLFLVGLSIAPTLIVLANLVDAGAPRDRLGEAQAWLSTAYTAGTGAGTAVAGLLVDAGGPGRSLAGAAVGVGAAAVLALAGAAVFARSTPSSAPSSVPATLPSPPAGPDPCEHGGRAHAGQ